MKNSRKLIALALSLILCFSCLPAAFAAEAENYPIVYIKGQGSALTIDATMNGRQIYPIEFPDGYLGDTVKELAVPLAYAMGTDDWKPFSDGLYNAVMPFFEEVACDENGMVTNGSGSKWSVSTNPGVIQAGSALKVWFYDYDWRLDPVDCAESLHDYINFVKAKTGSEKVSIIARCLGADIVLAYADMYGMEDVHKCLFSCLGFDGFETFGQIFAGKAVYDAEALERFSDSFLSVEDYADDPTIALVRDLVTAMQATPLLGFTADAGNKLVSGIRDLAYKDLVRDALATTPSYWCYIGDDYYEDAKAFLFGGEEEKYANLIEKIDYFHYEILDRYEEILDEAEADGVYFYNVCKYGFQMIPALGKDYKMSDTLISTNRSSLGATCSDIDKTLSKSYLEKADAKYISPDKQIDASTCRYPEHTWFVKNMTHRNMPNSIDYLYDAILSAPGYATVDEVEGYPQFLMASNDGSTISPATAQNTQEPIDNMNTPPFIAFLRAVFNAIKMFFTKFFK